VTVAGIVWVMTRCTLVVAYVARILEQTLSIEKSVETLHPFPYKYIFFQICLLKPQTWKQHILRKRYT